MNEEFIKRILEKYHIKYKKFLPHEKGYRNTSFPVEIVDKKINIVLYKQESGILNRIKNANKIGDFLHDLGYPARSTYSDKILTISYANNLRYISVYNYIEGYTIPWEGYTMDRLKNLGKSMAEMHKLLSYMIDENLTDVTVELMKINKMMEVYFEKLGVINAINAKIGIKVIRHDFSKLINTCRKLSDKQVLHMDFVRGNILFNGKEIVGVLDFEKVSHGNKVVDIARTLAFLLIDCKYKSEEKIRKYFLQSGYIKYGEGTFTNYKINKGDLLAELVIFFMFYDFYKFLLHNPYESLSQNEHFLRTKTCLLKAGNIAKI